MRLRAADDGVPCQTSASRHCKLRQSLGKIKRFKVQINKNKQM
jgi:hypothetical protein